MAETPNVSLRIKPRILDEVDAIASRRQISRRAAVEMAIVHLAGTLANAQPVYVDLPERPNDDSPKSHKRRQRVA